MAIAAYAACLHGLSGLYGLSGLCDWFGLVWFVQFEHQAAIFGEKSFFLFKSVKILMLGQENI